MDCSSWSQALSTIYKTCLIKIIRSIQLGVLGRHATPTIPTTELLHVESGSLDNNKNTGTSKKLMPEPSVSVPSTQSIPMEERPQTESVSVIKDPTPGPSANETCTSTSSEGTKKHKALSGVQILEILKIN